MGRPGVEASPERPAPTPRVQPLLLALSLLTLVTGLVDAACYLGLGRVFTANMTGNVVLLAFGPPGPSWSCELLPERERARGTKPVTSDPPGRGHRVMAARRRSPPRPAG